MDLAPEVIGRDDFAAIGLDSFQVFELYMIVEDLGVELDIDQMEVITSVTGVYEAYAQAADQPPEATSRFESL
jgi:acyl carrier protein